MNIIGYFVGIDPAACLLIDGELVGYVEEERLLRFKHAADIFPIRAIDSCLRDQGLGLQDIDCFAYGWDVPAYTDGRMKAFFDELNRSRPPDEGTRAWQRRLLGFFHEDNVKRILYRELTAQYGHRVHPPLRFYPHHESHAATAFLLSPFEEALVFTVDGSGDCQTATLWHGRGTSLELLHEIRIPHSLGWFYAAITEYLGFKAYDGEYKVMGLAAYGRDHPRFRAAFGRIVRVTEDRRSFVVDPRYIHHGAHSYSDRFTDEMVTLLGLPPRLGGAPLEPVHEDLAFEAQRCLEEVVLSVLETFARETGLRNLCIAGGVGLNVKMNSRIHRSGLFGRVWPFPIPSDAGTSIGAAVGLYVAETGNRPRPLTHLALGPSWTDAEIERQVRSCGLSYRRCADIAEEAAALLAQGKVVAWYQGAHEGGPRALGGRSILADPRDVGSRDRVNAAIKFREYWRPFCPSLLAEAAPDYLRNSCDAPFMILAFEATDKARAECPAVVHVDGTVRPQTVDPETNPRYHLLLRAFARRTGVPVLLNTSFNVKGEAMVCSPRDALRTFWSTGLDALAIGDCLIEKPEVPVALPPEDATR